MGADGTWSQDNVMKLALENRDGILAFLMGLTKDPDKAEELFQNAYLVICRKWQQFRPGTRFISWAMTIARYEFLASVDPKRHRLVMVESEVLESALEAAEPEPQEDSTTAWRDALTHCLGQLAPRSRQAMELRYEQSLDGDGLARALGVSANALYSLLSRVRRTLRECVLRRLQADGGVA